MAVAVAVPVEVEMIRPAVDNGAVAEGTVNLVADRVARARGLLAATVARREAAVLRLQATGDQGDALVARSFTDFLLQADEVRRSGAALVVATGPGGDPVIGRMAVFDEDRQVVLIPWHSEVGQRQLLARDRLMASEQPDGSVQLHSLAADEQALATIIRSQMRLAAVRDRMSDPLATLTREQGGVLASIADTGGDIVLTGPPGSGKSAIVMVELARRLLSSQTPSNFRALFVTGTARLAIRATALTRLLGTASVTPIPQDDVLRFLGITDAASPAASDRDGDLWLPRALEDTFSQLRARLATEIEVAHPLGLVPAGDVDAVCAIRARVATQSYRASASDLAAALEAEYQGIMPGKMSMAAAAEATAALRPHITPTKLVTAAIGRRRLSRPVKAAAMEVARQLLASSPSTRRPRWDLVVVDEYQRLPDIVLWLLRRQAASLILSGDPLQSFAGDDAAAHLSATTPLALLTSLRMPSAVAAWIDATWQAHGIAPPRVRCAVEGGTVTVITEVPDAPDPGVQVIAPASLARHHDGWLDPAAAVGLEWPRVVLVAPGQVWEEHGSAGLFIAASRAIDSLSIVA